MTDVRRNSLDEDERVALSRVVTMLRTLLTKELSRVLEGTFGIKAGRELPEDESRLSLGPDELEARRELVGIWELLSCRADLLVREAAFTHTNRLIAVRVAEALGLLPESLARGRRSSGFRQLLEVAPLLGSDDDAGYWEYLQLCGDELAHDVPRLFDPRNPLLALRPPPSVVDELVELISADDLGVTGRQGAAWAAPDTLGWTYQFFNSDEERSEMRRQHPQPVDSWELAVRNQFFTPDYVVGFLVHNTLGRRLVEGGVFELADELEYLVDPPTELGEPLDLDDVKVLDPACGSGHFLLGAFDLLERAWLLRGVPPAESAASIVASLWGIDIDARAAQVAASAIMLRARRFNPDGDLPTPNIVCARAVPGGAAGRSELLASVEVTRRDFLAELVDQLDRAPELGSLLRVDELLRGETARMMTFGGGRQGAAGRRKKPDQGVVSLVDAGIEAGILEVDTVVDEVLAAARATADKLTSSPQERVLAAEGGDALRLVQALSHRYDAVLMNPPFGEPIAETKPYLKAAYPWIPKRDYNLFAAFVGRGLELCNSSGYLGAITSRAGMFLTTFERWRSEVLLGNDLVALTDLGLGVMHEALVEAAAYVVRPGQSRHSRPTTFIRLLREPLEKRPAALREVCARVRANSPDGRVFHLTPDAFDAVPGAPMAYWMTPDIRRLFRDFPSLEGHGVDIRVGLQTGDDFRFVRAFWEVDSARVGRSRDETFAGKRWVPFAKGGEYSPFWADIHLVVDYERDGEKLHEFRGAVIRNPQYYFRPGLTWPRRTNSGFGVRVLPAGCAFADKGPAIFADTSALPAMLGWLRSRFVQGLLELSVSTADETSSGGQSRSYEVGLVQKLPWPGEDAVNSRLADRMIECAATSDLHAETTRRFLAPRLNSGLTDDAAVSQHLEELAQHLKVLELSANLEGGIADGIHLSKEALVYFDEEVSCHPMTYERRDDVNDDIARMYVEPIDRTIREFISTSGGSRAVANLTFITDRRLEVIAHSLRVHPGVVVEVVAERGLLPPGEREAWARSVASYLVGCAFGRWDVRIGRDLPTGTSTTDDPFAPVPICSPGMLVGPERVPTKGSPEDYPLSLTEHRVLVDEPGHPAAIDASVEAAAAALVEDPSTLIDEVSNLLDAPDFRTYLSKRFFKDHLAQYSKSRRKAPIYWPLTTASRAWTVWVYAPTLSREAIYSVAAHAERRLNATEVEIRRMESAQLQASTPGTSTHDPGLARTLTGRLDTERGLAEELRSFRRVVARVAESGWSPNLDDGIVLCAAPFAEVLPDWPKELVETRKQLRSGKFPWSDIHHYRESL